MTPSQSTDSNGQRPELDSWTRLDRANARDHFQRNPNESQRQYAQQHDIPRATLGDWLRQQFDDDSDRQIAALLQTPAGELLLRRVYLALFLDFHLRGACGLRLLEDFLRHTKLDRFVAASYGALHAFGQQLQQHLADFARDERARLAEGMAQRDIAVIADENFHGEHPCLVAIEAASGFILVEEVQPRRDAATWTDAIQRGTADLPVEVVLLTSDEASGLIACAGQLEAQHMPELFHGQRDLIAPILAPLVRQNASAEKVLGEMERNLQRHEEAQQRAAEEPARPGRPIDHAGRVERAEACLAGATEQLRLGEERMESVRQAVRGVADDFHPFDATTGAAVDGPAVAKRLEAHLASAEKVVEEAQLGARATAAIGRGRAWALVLVSVMSWFWTRLLARLGSLNLSEAAEKVVQEKLLAGLYWQSACHRARTPEERRRQRELGDGLVKEARSSSELSALTAEERSELERVCREELGLFQRSSSSVEGRNGRLSLFQHGHTRLNGDKLKALTVVHNYVSRRGDGTTAAERFFGKEQRDVLAWLLTTMADLPRPAARRPPKNG